MVRAIALSMLIAAGSAVAKDYDEAALSLADTVPMLTERPSEGRLLTEGAISQTTLRTGSSVRTLRLSWDLSVDKALTSNVRAVFADRLDLSWQDTQPTVDRVNTLKEAYISFRLDNDQVFDLGRINTRYGVALGYNPTDFFRTGAVRSVVSIDPDSLRKNRLGSVMVKGQKFWNGGSLTALYSPKLATQPSTAAFSPDFGATNSHNRWLISASQQINPQWNPQVSLSGGEDISPILGINQSFSLGNSTVTYFEWSGGRSQSLESQALKQADDAAFRTRLATGLTYTTANKLSATLEYEYNGAAMDKLQWDALWRGPANEYWQYRQWAQTAQELPTKNALFLYVSWQDALINHLDINAMARFDIIDRSQLTWVEARYHWDRIDLAFQLQSNRGHEGSTYGALPQRQIWQLMGIYYF